MRWREGVYTMRLGMIVAGVLAVALASSVGHAAEQAADTGRMCAVGVSSGRNIGEPLAAAGVAAVTKGVQTKGCQPGDVLEMTYAEGNPAPIVAQFCDLGRQVFLYTPPPNYAQVGITSELVCSLVGARRAGR